MQGLCSRLADIRRQDGHVLVMTGLLLAPLLVFAAFATDVGAWVTTAGRMQRAADAAATAGAAELPDLVEAEAVATAVMERNGFVTGADSITVGVTSSLLGGVAVDVADADPPMFFAGLVLPSLTIERAAVATSRPSLSLGSPNNFLGNDPIRGEVPNYWLMTYGPQNAKINGDRFHTQQCGAQLIVGCTSTATGTVNDEYNADGYFYQSEVKSVLGGLPLRFEIFDPVFHNVGGLCDSPWLLDPGTAAAQPWYGANTAGLGDFSAERYEQGTHEWCASDAAGGGDFRTTVLVREPDETPGSDLDNPVVCAMEFRYDTPTSQADFALRLASDTTYTFPRWVDSGSIMQPAPALLAFRDYFRNWVEICEVSTPMLGTYLLQVRTNADRSNPPASLVNPDPSIQTMGQNAYALRLGWGSDATDPAWGSGLSLGARERLPIVINADVGPVAGSTLTTFTLVRATAMFAGEQMKVDFFDIADGYGDITLRVRGPAAFENAGGVITCSFTKAGVPKAESAECEIQEPSGGGNGLVYQATIVVPPDYTCDELDKFACWFRVEITFGGQPRDITTWSAYAPGLPVRLTG